MLRHYTFELLAKLTKGDGTSITDAEIVDWVNKKVVFVWLFEHASTTVADLFIACQQR